jgi:hypothetical protein
MERNRRGFLGSLVALPVAALATGKGLSRVRITVGPKPLYGGADMKVWLDGVDITMDIPIRNERRLRRARPGQTLTFTIFRRNEAGSFYIEGGKAGRAATDVIRALVV